MRIGIDARFYGVMGKGLGRYVSELIAALERHDQRNDYVVFLRKENFDEYAPANARFSKALADIPWYGVAEQLRYPALLERHKLDLMHFANFNVPVGYRRPFVVTIHDLILLSHPSTRATTLGPLFYAAKFAAYKKVIGSAIRRSKKTIAVSEFTKKEILRWFPFADERRIAVTHLAPGRLKTAAELPADALVALPVAKPFALYVGNAYPHKNLERLLAAFALFRASNPEFSLVLVGELDYFYKRLAVEATRRNLADRVILFGKATDAQLSQLYAHAAFYVFPSLCEGFGIPPLEAMAVGLPVISSSATAMPEILGDAAMYFDPNDEQAIAAAMTKVADDDVLRMRLAGLGPTQAGRYSWDNCAKATLAAYDSALTT